MGATYKTKKMFIWVVVLGSLSDLISLIHFLFLLAVGCLGSLNLESLRPGLNNKGYEAIHKHQEASILDKKSGTFI